MKWICALLVFSLPVLASAQEAAPIPLKSSNVEMIDGKKFFSLNNARRMQATSGPLSPSTMAIMNHPRTDYRVPNTERLSMTPVTHAKGTSPLPWIQNSPNAGLSKSDQVKQQLLSIFAPEDKGAIPTPMPAIK